MKKPSLNLALLTWLSLTSLYFFPGCEILDQITVTTRTVTGIQARQAIGGGSIKVEGSTDDVDKYGLYWSTLLDPLNDSLHDFTSTTGSPPDGSYTNKMVELVPETKYYVQAVVWTINNKTVSGDVVSFTTTRDSVLPTLETLPVRDILSTNAISGGKILSSGKSPVIEQGVCWSIPRNPDLNDPHSSDGSGINEYTSILSGLEPGTQYFVRAYATNSYGTGYGQEVVFKTAASGGTGCQGLTSVTDPRDGQVYSVVQIGDQCWLQKNMNYQAGNNWCYNDNTDNCTEYGKLYNWQTAQNVCPTGWHLPSEDEWIKLINSLGGYDLSGDKLKESGTAHWNSPNSGTNSSGFTAMGGGGRYFNGYYNNFKSQGQFWSSTSIDNENAKGLTLYYNLSNTYIFSDKKAYGFSVRCVKDK